MCVSEKPLSSIICQLLKGGAKGDTAGIISQHCLLGIFQSLRPHNLCYVIASHSPLWHLNLGIFNFQFISNSCRFIFLNISQTVLFIYDY